MAERGFGIIGLGVIAEFHAKAIENMTGLDVRTVNVRIAGICVAGE